MKSRITEYINHQYCELDGSECTRCQKCEYLPSQSSNRLNNFLIVCVIVCVIIFVLNPLLMMGVEKNSQINIQSTDDSTTLEDRVDNYNQQMSDDEREYREYTGLGNESIGDNYNPMG